MEFIHFIGIDVSKLTLDVTLMRDGNVAWHLQVSNDRSGILSIFKRLKSDKTAPGETLFCCEHTGIYNEPLIAVLTQKKAAVWMESALRIKQSSGLQRGKNDKVDSERIARYAYVHRHQVKLWQPPRAVVKALRELMVLRSRLVAAVKLLRVPLQENGPFMDKSLAKKVSGNCRASLKALEADLTNTNADIQRLIKSDPELNRLFNLVTSVDAVGPVVAASLLVVTDEFKRFDSPKQFAAYAGVAPYEHSSGSSVRGKHRVSHLANKSVKTLLHLSALSARTMKGEMREYYERKITEGKNPMSVINALRNKLVARIFACVKHNRPYQKILQPMLA
jgi:transposase